MKNGFLTGVALIALMPIVISVPAVAQGVPLVKPLSTGPAGSSMVRNKLAASVRQSLDQAATQSDAEFLQAVSDAVSANPEQAARILEYAQDLRFDLAGQIANNVAAASAGSGATVSVGQGVSTLGFGSSAAAALSTEAMIAIGVGAAAGIGGMAAGSGGGGGGGSGGTIDYTPSTDAAYYVNSEFNGQGGLGLIKAQYAYARGGAGQGVLVGVVDSGVDRTNPDLAGKVTGWNVGNDSTNPVDSGVYFRHGTHVAGIIAATRNGSVMHGVAYGASIYGVNLLAHQADWDNDLALAYEKIGTAGGRIVNNSWGGGHFLHDLNTADIPASATYIRSTLSPAYAAKLDSLVAGAAENRIISVYAAGNDYHSEVSLDAGLPYYIPELKDTWVTVVSVDTNKDLAWYSNQCGLAKDFCMAAPGGDALTTGQILSTVPVGTGPFGGGNYERAEGTSMAAPQVSGALAVVASLFPSKTPEWWLDRIKTTAEDIGAVGVDAVFGLGLLDLEAASTPVGPVSVAVTSGTSGSASSASLFSVGASVMTMSAAFGDGPGQALANRSMMVLDSQQAPFLVDMGALAQRAPSAYNIERRMVEFGQPMDMQRIALAGLGEASFAFSNSASKGAEVSRMAFASDIGGLESRSTYNVAPNRGLGLVDSGAIDPDAMANADAFSAPYLSLAEDGFTTGVTFPVEGVGSMRVMAFMGERSDTDTGITSAATGMISDLQVPVGERSMVSFQLGSMNESGTFLGAYTSGAFATESGTPTTFAGLSAEAALTDQFSLVGSYFAGVSMPQAQSNGLLRDLSPVTSSTFSLGVIGRAVVSPRDRMGVVLSQPLRVSSASATVNVSDGMSSGDILDSHNERVDLSPAGRELDLEVFYQAPLGEGTSMTSSLLLRNEPDHLRDADMEAAALFRFTHAF